LFIDVKKSKHRINILVAFKSADQPFDFIPSRTCPFIGLDIVRAGEEAQKILTPFASQIKKVA
jgi:hypothetical protein